MTINEQIDKEQIEVIKSLLVAGNHTIFFYFF